jgi:hypothetical protein
MGRLYFGFQSDPLQQNKKTTYEVFFYRGAVVIKVTVDNYTVRFNGPIIDPALTEEVKGELQSRWYKKLPGEKVSLDAPDDYKEILYGVTYKWITKHLSWDATAGRLIAL